MLTLAGWLCVSVVCLCVCGTVVVSICLWTNPLTSALTLLSLLLLLFLLHRGYTLLTLLSYLLMLQLLTCLLFINASKVILKLKGQEAAKPAVGNPANSEPPARPDFVSEAAINSLVPLVHSSLNVLLHACMDLIRCVDNAATLRAIVVLLLASLLGRLLDGVSTCLLLLAGALALPKPYLLNQPLVHRAAAQALRALHSTWSVLGTKISATATATATPQDLHAAPATEQATAATATAPHAAAATASSASTNDAGSAATSSSAESKKNA